MDAGAGCDTGHGVSRERADLAEIAALKKEVARLRAERDILKKAAAFFRARGDMRFAFIAEHRHIWPVSWLCDVLDVSRPGFHAWLTRPTSAREIHDAKLVTAIEASFRASDRSYGLAASGAMCWGKDWPAAFTGSNG